MEPELLLYLPKCLVHLVQTYDHASVRQFALDHDNATQMHGQPINFVHLYGQISSPFEQERLHWNACLKHLFINVIGVPFHRFTFSGMGCYSYAFPSGKVGPWQRDFLSSTFHDVFQEWWCSLEGTRDWWPASQFAENCAWCITIKLEFHHAIPQDFPANLTILPHTNRWRPNPLQVIPKTGGGTQVFIIGTFWWDNVYRYNSSNDSFH